MCVCVCVCVYLYFFISLFIFYTCVFMLHATEKTVTNILRKRIKKKTEHKLRDQFGFRRGKGNRGAIGMLRITLERIHVIDEDCVLVSCTGRRTN